VEILRFLPEFDRLTEFFRRCALRFQKQLTISTVLYLLIGFSTDSFRLGPEPSRFRDTLFPRLPLCRPNRIEERAHREQNQTNEVKFCSDHSHRSLARARL